MLKSWCLLPGLLLTPLVSETVSAFPATPVLAAPQDKEQKTHNNRVLKLVGTWLKLYRNHAWGLEEVLTGTKSLLRKTGIQDLNPPRRGRGRGRGGRGGGGGRGRGRGPQGPTAKDELRILLQHARRIRAEKAARLVLEVAAVGLDRRYKYTAEMIPHSVRQMGEKTLLRMRRAAVLDYLVTAAKGEPGGPGALKTAMHIAALRVLAEVPDGSYLELFESQLDHHDYLVRMAVAEGLGC